MDLMLKIAIVSLGAIIMFAIAFKAAIAIDNEQEGRENELKRFDYQGMDESSNNKKCS